MGADKLSLPLPGQSGSSIKRAKRMSAENCCHREEKKLISPKIADADTFHFPPWTLQQKPGD
eukprot:1443044-Pleurochrysis_carterae.AAC.2